MVLLAVLNAKPIVFHLMGVAKVDTKCACCCCGSVIVELGVGVLLPGLSVNHKFLVSKNTDIFLQKPTSKA